MKIKIFISLLIISFFKIAVAQPPMPNPSNCQSGVPYHYVNLVGQPDGQWTSPTHSRNQSCCGSNTRCTYFEVLLDPNAAMVEVGFDLVADPSQAIPSGSLYYQINCGPEIPVGSPICISGPGPHHITFCKPGNNRNTYYIKSIAKPTFPPNDTVRIKCAKPLRTYGLVPGTISWNSIYPGAPGAYNSYLSCTNCANPTYTPAISGAPPYIDYRVCGSPTASTCGYVYSCDTVRIYNLDSLYYSVTPNPASFCVGSGGVTLNSIVNGGDPASYSYIWRQNTPSQVIGTSSSVHVTTGGGYSLEVRDRYYHPLYCPSPLKPVIVNTTNPPTLTVGPDQILCPESPNAFITANFTNATGVVWSGGSGTFSPNDTILGNGQATIMYVPTPAEVLSGSVTLTATSYGHGAGCAIASDQITLTFPPAIIVSLNDTMLNCFGDVALLTPQITHGTGPFNYAWNNGATSTSISVGAGNYCVNVTDNLGCIGSTCANVLTPAQLQITMSSTGVSPTDLDVNGTATANPIGGTSPYNYLWNNGQPTQTATGLA
ncbi:MAG: hypothetical protein N2167_11580, partial [Flavobacteriales bacterium]|nr:hypothetical protein [Flavobacteriales bacterium]